MALVSEATLYRAFEQLGLPGGEQSVPKLLIIKDFLRFYGRSMNLTAKLDDASLDEHVLEALQVVALAKQLELDGTWLDVGSGGGFPGLVVAACLENQLTLVEPRAKRASVLELGLGKLRRRNARVLRGRIESGRWVGLDGGRLDPGFSVATARAVFAPERWISEATPWMGAGGVVIVHLRPGEVVAGEVLGRLDGERWSAVGIRVADVPRGT